MMQSHQEFCLCYLLRGWYGQAIWKPPQLSSFPTSNKILGATFNYEETSERGLSGANWKIKGGLGPWRTSFPYQSGRLILVQALLSAIQIFHLMSLDPPPWVFKAIDKIKRAFYGRAHIQSKATIVLSARSIFADQKLVADLESCVSTLEIMNTTLRLHWAWKVRASGSRSWSILVSPLERHERQLFNAATKVALGSGQKCFFLDGQMDSRCFARGTCTRGSWCCSSGRQIQENSSWCNYKWGMDKIHQGAD